MNDRDGVYAFESSRAHHEAEFAVVNTLHGKNFIDMYWVYVLKSRSDNNLYIGYSKDYKKRLIERNSGKSKSTKFRRPLVLIFCEGFANKADALRRENYFKTNPGKRALKIMLKEYNKSNK